MLGGDLLTGLALGSQLISTTQLAHDVLRGMPLPTSHLFIVPSSPTSGHRTLKEAGLIQWEHATTTTLPSNLTGAEGKPSYSTANGEDAQRIDERGLYYLEAFHNRQGRRPPSGRLSM